MLPTTINKAIHLSCSQGDKHFYQNYEPLEYEKPDINHVTGCQIPQDNKLIATATSNVMRFYSFAYTQKNSLTSDSALQITHFEEKIIPRCEVLQSSKH